MKYQAVIGALRRAGYQAGDWEGFKVSAIGTSYCTVRYGRHFTDPKPVIQDYKKALEDAGFRCSFDNLPNAPDVLFVYEQ